MGLASAAAAGGLAVVAASPAQAMYEDCYAWTDGRFAYGSCWGRGAQWRLHVDCPWDVDERTKWRWLSRERVTVSELCYHNARAAHIEFRYIR